MSPWSPSIVLLFHLELQVLYWINMEKMDNLLAVWQVSEKYVLEHFLLSIEK